MEGETQIGEEFPLDHQPKGWPYEEGRLKQIDYQAIIDAGQPWTDPDFMPDSESIFIMVLLIGMLNSSKRKLSGTHTNG